MAKTKHLKTKFSIATFNLISQCSSDELKFYLYVKLYAINQNSAFPSQRSFKRDLGWSSYTTTRIVKQMEAKKRLKVERQKGKNNIYDITWYDTLNEKSIQESLKNTTLETSGTSTLETSGTTTLETLGQTNRNKTNRNKTIKTEQSSEKEEDIKNILYRYLNRQDSKGKIQDTKNSKVFQIIAFYWVLSGQTISNAAQWKSFVKRNIKIATDVVEQGLSSSMLIRAACILKTKNLSWTLETLANWALKSKQEIANMKSDELSRFKSYEIQTNKLVYNLTK